MARGQGEALALRCLDWRPLGPPGSPSIPGLALGTLQSPKRARGGLSARDSRPRCSPGLLRARALGTEVGKDLWAEGPLRGQVGRGHALCSGLAVNERTEPQKAGPCPYFSSGHNLAPHPPHP